MGCLECFKALYSLIFDATTVHEDLRARKCAGADGQSYLVVIYIFFLTVAVYKYLRQY